VGRPSGLGGLTVGALVPGPPGVSFQTAT
jgi:hypothetical protein